MTRPTTILHEALGEAQRLGFLGGRPIDDVVEHARSFVVALQGIEGSVLDLGTGGGVPGLVIAADRPDLDVTLLDRRTKRTDFLERIVGRLGWSPRVHIVNGDADQVWSDSPARFDAVVARGFGPPADTLRTAARFARPGGVIVVSEPPSGDRWPAEALIAANVIRLPSGPQVACFERLD